MTVTIDWGIIASLVVALAALVTAYTTRRKLSSDIHKTEAEASDHISEAAISLIKPLKDELKITQEELTNMRAQVEILSRHVQQLTRENGRLKIQIDILSNQIKDLGGNPCVLPETVQEHNE